MSIRCTIENYVAEVVMHHPPVNSITVADTWKIRDTFAELDRNPEVRVIILTAEGKGFNAGIDINDAGCADSGGANVIIRATCLGEDFFSGKAASVHH